VLEFAPAKLDDFGTANEGEDDVGRKALLNGGLEAERMGGINKDTGMLRGNDRVDHGGEIVYVGEGFYGENDIVKCTLSARCSFFG